MAQEANSEAIDLLSTKQLGIAVRGGAEGILYATIIFFWKTAKIKKIQEWSRLISKITSIRF